MSQAFADSCEMNSANLPLPPETNRFLDQVCPKNQMKIQYDGYLKDTLASLEKLRGPNGLLMDKAQVMPGKPATLKVLNSKTSPTNIGFDLMILSAEHQMKTLDRVLDTLGTLPHHKKTGLYFSWYRTDRTDESSATFKDVSSIDNLHLALGLWTVAQKYPNTEVGKKALKIFRRMNFSIFYDEKTGLSGGNLAYHQDEKTGKEEWVQDAYKFSYMGAEARSLYSVGNAIGVFKKQANRPDAVQKSIEHATTEFYKSDQGKILKTWDGGAFQLLLPEILSSESHYSNLLKQSSQNYGKFILAGSQKKDSDFPDAHSASQYGIDGDKKKFKNVPPYVGPAGNIELVASSHTDVNDPKARAIWDEVYTPHAAMMAASVSPETFSPVFKANESYHSGDDKLYTDGLGWSDGVHMKGANKGDVVPVVLALDQSMIALSLLKINDPDGLSPSARALNENPKTRAKLEEFYKKFDEKNSALFNP